MNQSGALTGDNLVLMEVETFGSVGERSSEVLSSLKSALRYVLVSVSDLVTGNVPATHEVNSLLSFALVCIPYRDTKIEDRTPPRLGFFRAMRAQRHSSSWERRGDMLRNFAIVRFVPRALSPPDVTTDTYRRKNELASRFRTSGCYTCWSASTTWCWPCLSPNSSCASHRRSWSPRFIFSSI